MYRVSLLHVRRDIGQQDSRALVPYPWAVGSCEWRHIRLFGHTADVVTCHDPALSFGRTSVFLQPYQIWTSQGLTSYKSQAAGSHFNGGRSTEWWPRGILSGITPGWSGEQARSQGG